jgi:hypothetical protein
LAGTVQRGEPLFSPENLVDPKHYYCIPDEGIREDLPFSLVLRPPIRLSREETGIKVRYLTGYATGRAPADLEGEAERCLGEDPVEEGQGYGAAEEGSRLLMRERISYQTP